MPLTKDDVRETVQNELEGSLDRLNHQLEKINELEEDIQEAARVGKGVSDLKEKVQRRGQEVSDLVDEVQEAKDLIEKQRDRLDEFESDFNPNGGKRGGPDIFAPGKKMVERVQEKFPSERYDGNRARQQTKIQAQFESWNLSQRHLARQAIQKDITSASGSGGDLTQAQRVGDGPIEPGTRTLTIRDLLPVSPISTDVAEFVRESAVTDNAGPQDEQSDPPATKGESDFTFNAASERVRTLAHWVKVTTQLLDDVDRLESYINGRMRFLLLQEEEDQLLLGSGTGQDLNGIQTQADSYSISRESGVSNAQQLDRLRKAIEQVRVSHFSPTAMVLHPEDWGDIELLKDGNNQYLFVNPQDAGTPRLWGLPVVSTTAQTSDNFLVGGFAMGAELFDRRQAQVSISTEDDDNFQRNLATIRAEERVVVVVYRTSAFVTGTFSAT